MKTNRHQEAYEVLKKGAKALPEYIPLHEGVAKVSVQLNKYQEALKECQAALAINDRYFNALALSGGIYDKLGDKEKAIDYLQRALDIEPENKLLLLDYAQVLATSGRGEEAVEVYKKLKADYPDDFMIYQYLGITYGNMGKIEESIENLKRAIALRPNPLSFFNLAVALEKTGNIKEAAHYMKEYLRTTPEGDTPRKRNAQQKLALWEKRL